MWAGIVGNHPLGPVILPGYLNGVMYLNFLRTTLEGLLDDLPLDLWRDIWLPWTLGPCRAGSGRIWIRDFQVDGSVEGAL